MELEVISEYNKLQLTGYWVNNCTSYISVSIIDEISPELITKQVQSAQLPFMPCKHHLSDIIRQAFTHICDANWENPIEAAGSYVNIKGKTNCQILQTLRKIERVYLDFECDSFLRIKADPDVLFDEEGAEILLENFILKNIISEIEKLPGTHRKKVKFINKMDEKKRWEVQPYTMIHAEGDRVIQDYVARIFNQTVRLDASTSTIDELYSRLHTNKTDIILINPTINGCRMRRDMPVIRKFFPEVKIALLWSGACEESLLQFIDLVDGHLSLQMNSSELIIGVSTIMEEGSYFSLPVSKEHKERVLKGKE